MDLDYEYCHPCDDVYAVRAVAWLCFDNLRGETFDNGSSEAECPRCGFPLVRFHGYLESLTRRDTLGFIDGVISDISDLSDMSKELLRGFMNSFSVPSFSTIVRQDGVIEETMELYRKRYVYVQQTEDYAVVTLNAYKLGLFDFVDILSVSSIQRSFIKNPGYIRDEKGYLSSLRRENRLRALPNDLTKEEETLIRSRFNDKCAFTGRDVPIHLDHVIPVAVGHGGTTVSNILPIWQRINSSKGAKNVFEWYEENGDKFGVCPERFKQAIKYLAKLNEMSVEEYREYVYECHANPIDKITEVMSNEQH